MKNKIVIMLAIMLMMGCSGGAASDPQAGNSNSTEGTGRASGTPTPVASKPIVDNEDLTPGLMGVDADKNGIRDDIDRLIAQKYSATPEMKKAAEQKAKALQKFMEAADKTQARLAQAEISRAWGCVYKSFPHEDAKGRKLIDHVSKEIEALTANTRERFTKYWNSNKLISGTIFYRSNKPACD
jgi:hypothetical protein